MSKSHTLTCPFSTTSPKSGLASRYFCLCSWQKSNDLQGSSNLNVSQFKHVTYTPGAVVFLVKAVSFTVKWSNLSCPCKHKTFIMWKIQRWTHQDIALTVWRGEVRSLRSPRAVFDPVRGRKRQTERGKEERWMTEGMGAGRIMLRRKRKIWTQSRKEKRGAWWKSWELDILMCVKSGGQERRKRILAEFRRRHRCCKTCCASQSGASYLTVHLSIYSICPYVYLILKSLLILSQHHWIWNLTIKSPCKSHGISHPIRAAG